MPQVPVLHLHNDLTLSIALQPSDNDAHLINLTLDLKLLQLNCLVHALELVIASDHIPFDHL